MSHSTQGRFSDVFDVGESVQGLSQDRDSSIGTYSFLIDSVVTRQIGQNATGTTDNFFIIRVMDKDKEIRHEFVEGLEICGSIREISHSLK